MKGTWETRITSDTYSPTQETQSLVICVPLPRKHISLVICVPLPRKHISLVISVPLPRKHIFLVIHVPLPGKQISLVICVPLPWETHITRDMCFLGRGRDMCFPGRGTCITWWYMFPTYGAHISLGICVSWVGKHISLVICDMCSLTWERHIPSVCVPYPGTLNSVMCSLVGETHFTTRYVFWGKTYHNGTGSLWCHSNMCFPVIQTLAITDLRKPFLVSIGQFFCPNSHCNGHPEPLNIWAES